MSRALHGLAVVPVLALVAACHLFIGREPDPAPACNVPDKIAAAPSGKSCKACLEAKCCDLVGECSGSCASALEGQFECVRANLGESNDTRPEISSWIRATCDTEVEQTAASKAAAACMITSCSTECFPSCPAGVAASDCVGRRCRLGPALPSFAGSGCDERILEERCCEIVNDCLEDRPCLNAVRCLERAGCLYAIGLANPGSEPCAQNAKCFVRGQPGVVDVALPLLQGLVRCIPPSGACTGPPDASPDGTGDGPGDASLDGADATAE